MNGRALLMLAAGFIIWSSAFVVLYAMLSVGCRFGWHEIDLGAGLSVQRAQLAAIFVLHLAAGTALVFVLRGRVADAPMLPRASYLSALSALGSTVFCFAPIFALSTCY